MHRPLGKNTIIILKPQITIDSRDNTEIISFTTPTQISVKNCMVEPFLLSDKLQHEITGDRDYARSTWRVWAPGTTDVMAIQPHDRIRFAGADYEIYGHIGVWYRFSGKVSHIQFIMEVREG